MVPAALPYADVATPAALDAVATVAVHPDLVRVLVPPPGWRRPSTRGLVTLAVVGLLAAVPLLKYLNGTAELTDVAPPPAMYLVGLVGLSALAYHRRHRRLAFEVTPYAFGKTVAGPFGVSRTAWPRSALLDVHLNPYSQHLILRLVGQDPLNVFLGLDPTANQRVVNELVAALATIAPAPVNSQVRMPNVGDGMLPSRTRSVLLIAALLLSLLAFLCVAFLGPFGCYAFILPAIPAGLAFGTQRKDIWT